MNETVTDSKNSEMTLPLTNTTIITNTTELAVVVSEVIQD